MICIVLCAAHNFLFTSIFAEGCKHHRNKKNIMSNSRFYFHFNSLFIVIYFFPVADVTPNNHINSSSYHHNG